MKNWYRVAQENQSLNVGDVFDEKDGIGATPNNMDVDYKGYRVFMLPSEFREKVLPGVSNEGTAEYIIQAIRSGQKIGQPMLYMSWLDEERSWIVTGHEGRSRSIAFETLFPGQKMEVHIITDIRPSNYTSDMRNAPILSENEYNRRERMEMERWNRERAKEKMKWNRMGL